MDEKIIDPEQEEKLAEILQLLVNAGYFRTKIHGLNIFDKVKYTYIGILLLFSRLLVEWFGVFHFVLEMFKLTYFIRRIQLLVRKCRL